MLRKCSPGVLEEICKFCEETEAPALFALWSGVFAIAASLKRDCFIDQGYFIVYPNMYINLTAGSGICRKSMAANIALDFLRRVEPPINLLSQRLTPSDLIGTLSTKKVSEGTKIVDEAVGCFMNDELSTLIDRTNEMRALVPLLTKLYDCKDFEYGTRKYGKERVCNPCLSILGGSTVEWIKDTFPPQSIGGGFTARFIFVFRNRRDRNIPWVRMSEANKARFDRIVHDLNQIAQMHGPMGVSEDAIALYSKEYEEFLKSPIAMDSLTSRYAERRHVHLLKLAIALSASQRDSREITKEDIWKAIQIIRTAEDSRAMIMRRIISAPCGDICEYVMELIMRNGMMHRANLIYETRHRITHKELDVICDGLCESGYVKKVTIGGELAYRYERKKGKDEG